MAMFMIEVGGVRVLYTGDFSRQPDRHLLGDFLDTSETLRTLPRHFLDTP